MLEYVDRRGTDCSKWDGVMSTFGTDGLLPFWVADMDFRVDSHIIDAVTEYMKTGVYGYYVIPESYYEAFIDWEREQHGFTVNRDWIRYSPGVVSGFNFAIQVLTQPGDSVIVTTPVYYPFLHAVEDNGRRLICSELSDRKGRYYIDFDDFEEKIIRNDVKAFIFCSPHNPVSRVWSADEIRILLDICRKHDVAVISDEIHHDLVFGDSVHIPTMSLAQEGDRIIMFTSASKSFNIAALRNSFVVIEDPDLRSAWDAFMKGLRLNMGNPMGYIASEAAYRYGKDWLDEVKGVISCNYNYIKDQFEAYLPEIVLTPLEGTYLAWADLRAYLAPEDVQTFMQEKCGLAFDYGPWFGGDESGTFIRINLATSKENIEEMVSRIIAGLK